MPTTIQTVAILGVIVSAYAVYVEAQHEANPFYVALCDINSWIACSRVFASEYGRVVGKYVVGMDSPLNLPNAVYGCMYYIAAYLHEVLTFIPYRRELMAIVATFVAAFSMWLGYILLFVLNDVCLVCMSTYVFNAIIVVSAWRALGAKSTNGDAKKRA